MVEHLYVVESPPKANELINVAWRATRRYVEYEWHTHGVSRQRTVYDGAETMTNYQIGLATAEALPAQKSA